MTDPYEYFVEPVPKGPTAMSDSLWRRAGQTGEYLSSLDWTWHEVHPVTKVQFPEPGQLRPITPEQAAALEADRHHWVRYWAVYLDPPAGPGDRPLTVVRRRSSPELILDESFTIDHRWERTGHLREAESYQASSPLHVVEIDQPTAERILREIRGADGATRL